MRFDTRMLSNRHSSTTYAAWMEILVGSLTRAYLNETRINMPNLGADIQLPYQTSRVWVNYNHPNWDDCMCEHVLPFLVMFCWHFFLRSMFWIYIYIANKQICLGVNLLKFLKHLPCLEKRQCLIQTLHLLQAALSEGKQGIPVPKTWTLPGAHKHPNQSQ